MISNMSKVDIIISSMVLNYLKKIDTNLAQQFKKKTNALTLSKGSPEIHLIFNHFIKTNCLSKEIKFDAVDDDDLKDNVQKKQKKAHSSSNKPKIEVKDVHRGSVDSASVDPTENTAIDEDHGSESEYEEDKSNEDLQLSTDPKNYISGAEMEQVEGEDGDDDSNEDGGDDSEDENYNEGNGLDNEDGNSNSQLEEMLSNQKTQEQSEDQEDQNEWAPKRGRGRFRNRGGFRRDRDQGWGEGRDGGGGGGNRGHFRGGFRGRFNDNRGGRGRGRGRGRFGGQEGGRGRRNFNNRHSNDFNSSSPQAKRFKFDN